MLYFNKKSMLRLYYAKFKSALGIRALGIIDSEQDKRAHPHFPCYENQVFSVIMVGNDWDKSFILVGNRNVYCIIVIFNEDAHIAFLIEDKVRCSNGGVINVTSGSVLYDASTINLRSKEGYNFCLNIVLRTESVIELGIISKDLRPQRKRIIEYAKDRIEGWSLFYFSKRVSKRD